MALDILLRDLREVKPDIEVRSVPGHENRAVDSEGNVWKYRKTKRAWHKCRTQPDRQGYLRLVFDGKVHGVHVLVLESFVGPRPKGMDASHYPDPDPANNRLSNLRWESHRENMSRKIEHGTYQGGEKNNGAKLTEAQVVDIRERFATGELAADLAAIFGVTVHRIRRIVQREIWKCVAPRPCEEANIRKHVEALSKRLARAREALEAIQTS